MSARAAYCAHWWKKRKRQEVHFCQYCHIICNTNCMYRVNTAGKVEQIILDKGLAAVACGALDKE